MSLYDEHTTCISSAGPTPQLIQHPIPMKHCKTTCWQRMIVCSDNSAQGCQRISKVGIQVEVFARQLLDLLLLLSNRMVEVVLGERDKKLPGKWC